MRAHDLSARLDWALSVLDEAKLPVETRLAMEAAAEVLAEKLTQTEQKQLEKGEKKHARKKKVWTTVTSQPEKHKNAWLGRASFYWKDDQDEKKHSVNITLSGPAKLSIKGKDLHVAPKEGEDYTWGEEHEAQEGAPEPAGEETKIDPTLDADGDGVADASRVGIPAALVLPPPKLPSLPGLTEAQAKVEADWNGAIEADPEATAQAYLNTVMEKAAKSGGPPEFVTDDTKLLQPDYRGKTMVFKDKDGKPILDKNGKEKIVPTPETQAWRARNNVLLHQGANAIAKRAFLKQLDELAKLEDGDPRKSVLVTSGGTGSGKGHFLKHGPEEAKAMKASTGAVWDAAGEQNATENPWILEEAEKRGIKSTFLFIDADPKRQWTHKKLGVVQRAADPEGEGRMVDARLHADSYAIGAKNFKAFHDKHKSRKDDKKPEFVVVNTWDNDDKGFPVMKVRKEDEEIFDDRTEKLDSDELYGFATEAIQKSAPTEAIKEGATVGQPMWGPPGKSAPAAEAKPESEAKASVLAAVLRTERQRGTKRMAGDEKGAKKLKDLLTKNFEDNMANLDDFLAGEREALAEKVKLFEKVGFVYDKDGKLVLPKG